MKDMTDGLGCTKVFYDVVQITEVAVGGGLTALGTGEGDCSHDIRATFSEVEEDS